MAPGSPVYIPRPASITLTGLGKLRASGVAAGIKASGKRDVGLLVADEAIPCAAVFTRNAFAAAPVRVCRDHLARSGGMVRAIVVNAGNANACTGATGEEHAARTCAQVAGLVGCPVEQVLVASTGVIGVPLPIEKLLAGANEAFRTLATDVAASQRFLDAIQTTDGFPKAAGDIGPDYAVAGVAKGAGMIEPNMATMLAFLGTSGTVSSAELASWLPSAMAKSFNAIHVDSHASTNDSVFVFSTGAAAKAAEGLRASIELVCQQLAWLIARDGEGATKVTTIDVRNAPSEQIAARIARTVAHSALVRTALFGNDPNWGRFVSALGNVEDVGDTSRLECRLQDILVFAHGGPTPFDRSDASTKMAQDDVSLVLDLHNGDGFARVLTSDLGYRYVEINAEYTT